MKARWYDNEQLRRMERILDQTYTDLGIDSASHDARHTRELVARLLFEYEVYQHTELNAVHVLRAKAHLHLDRFVPKEAVVRLGYHGNISPADTNRPRPHSRAVGAN